MSDITIFVFIIIGAMCVVFYCLKTIRITSINGALKDKDLNKVLELTDTKLINEYTRDLYRAKAYYREGAKTDDLTLLKQHLREMMKKSYESADTREYLTLYYHFFFERKDYEFSNEMLENIIQYNDLHIVRHTKWAKEVMIDGRNDLIEEMEAIADNKVYYGFPLGVIVTLIGVQYYRLEQYQEAYDWLNNAIMIFRPKDFYVKQVKELIEKIRPFVEKEEIEE